MAELKTKKNDASVDAFLDGIKDPQQRKDAKTLNALMQKATGEKPRMWGSAIVGYGEYSYIYASGRTGVWMQTGFSPRKGTLTVYLMAGVERHKELLAKLGPYSCGGSCLYLKNLDAVDHAVLGRMVKAGVDALDAHTAERKAFLASKASKKPAKKKAAHKKAVKKKPAKRKR